MKKSLLTVLAAAFLLTACTDKEKTFEKIFRDIKSEFAPDSRSKIFEASIKKQNGIYVLNGITTEQEAKDLLASKLEKEGMKIADSIVLLPSAEIGEKKYGITALSVINMRMNPGYAAEAGTQTLLGTPLRILQNNDGWLRVITPEGYIAWVTEKSVKAVNEKDAEIWKKSPKWMISTYYTTLRAEPKENAETVCDAVFGGLVAKAGNSIGKYHKVILPDGRAAYLLKEHAEDFEKWLEKTKPTPESIITMAKNFLGFPYMWGGTSVKAMDCSGFTKTVYLLNGIILARDASQQAYTGENIDISAGVENLKMGDLIFFGRKATAENKEKVTHVGIYIGNGKFIHSATYVRINSLTEGTPDYYEGSKRLIRAQRILGYQDSGKGIISVKNHPWYI